MARAGIELEVDLLHGLERAELAAECLGLEAGFAHGVARLALVAAP